MSRLGPATPEGAISEYGPLLCSMIANSITGTDARLKWDLVRHRLDGLQDLVGVNSAQDVRHKLMRGLEAEQDKVMLLDVRMAVMDGLETLCRLKAAAPTRTIPVIVLSAALTAKQTALDRGARFFLEKPFDSQSLLDALHTAIAE